MAEFEQAHLDGLRVLARESALRTIEDLAAFALCAGQGDQRLSNTIEAAGLEIIVAALERFRAFSRRKARQKNPAFAERLEDIGHRAAQLFPMPPEAVEP